MSWYGKRLRRPVELAMALVLAVLEAGLAVPCRAGAEEAPVFKPGIPGLKMVDVREHKLLWRELEELQAWEGSDRISVAEYRSKAIEKTVQFLGLDGAAADRFTAAAAETVAKVRESFLATRRAGGDLGVAEDRFSSDMGAGVARLSALLTNEPRHQLFAPDCKKWLLRLALGPTEAKEAKEARKGANRR